TAADRMGGVARGVAGFRSGWRTSDANFDADRKAQKEAENANDQRALLAARERGAWRRERQAAEKEWQKWGEKLGRQLHDMGRTLSLRRDDPDEYNDESDYYAINILTTRERGDVVKELRLDHLIHSYWNPDQPGKLYYDYEQVYAAVTERAAAMSAKPTEVSLDELPGGDALLAAFPPGISYERRTRTLSVRRTMQFSQLRRMLTIGPHAAFGEALFSTWEQAWNDWKTAARRHGGVVLTNLGSLPEGVTFPPALARKVHYDGVLKALVCTGSF